MTDPISDFLTRLRNGIMARHRTVNVPASKLKHRMAVILRDEGYIQDVQQQQNDGRPVLTLTLRYDEQNAPVMNRLEALVRHDG